MSHVIEPVDDAAPRGPSGRSRSALGIFVRDRWAMLGAVVLATEVFLAIFASVLYPSDPLATVGDGLQPPGTNPLFPLGTDTLGRDIAAGLIHGTRISLTVGLCAAVVSLALGIVLGVASGYFGGKVDLILTRVTELFQATPGFLLAIVVVSLGGPSISVIVIAITLGAFPTVARLVRAEFRYLRESDFVAAARAQGYSDLRIMLQDILPNTLPPVIVTTSVLTAGAILSESGLSFLGLGDPNKVSWGSMIGEGREMLQSAWYLTGLPGLMIIITILSLNLIGDGLNEALNPRLRQHE